jgi:hypothetical protein
VVPGGSFGTGKARSRRFLGQGFAELTYRRLWIKRRQAAAPTHRLTATARAGIEATVKATIGEATGADYRGKKDALMTRASRASISISTLHPRSWAFERMIHDGACNLQRREHRPDGLAAR